MGICEVGQETAVAIVDGEDRVELGNIERRGANVERAVYDGGAIDGERSVNQFHAVAAVPRAVVELCVRYLGGVDLICVRRRF